MSLKAFHMVFIALSALLLFGVLGWAGAGYARHPGGDHVVYGFLGLGGGMGLIGYGRYVWRKLRHISFL